MFKEVAIVLLTDMNAQFNWDLNWPVTCERSLPFKSNEELLKHMDIVSSYVSAIAHYQGHSQGSLLALPIHYRLLPKGVVAEVLGDVSLEHAKALSEVLSDYYAIESEASGYWVLRSGSVNFEEEDLTKRQEVEMLLYNHKVNQHRAARQYRPISGIRIVRVENPKMAKVVVSDASFMKLLAKTDSLSSWFNHPKGRVVVLGEEAGDGVIYPLQEVVVNMLESGKVSRVRVISTNKEKVYSANLFDRLWQKSKFAFESKQYS